MASHRLQTHRRGPHRVFSMIPSYFRIEISVKLPAFLQYCDASLFRKTSVKSENRVVREKGYIFVVYIFNQCIFSCRLRI